MCVACPAVEAAKARYAAVKARGAERLVSASDDFTMFMWSPTVRLEWSVGAVVLSQYPHPASLSWYPRRARKV